MLLSIIIPARDKPELTLSCLQALAQAELPFAFETLLVDNASEPPLAGLLPTSALQTANVSLLRNEENLSFSRANNLAAARAIGQLSLFLNNDVEVRPNTIPALVAALESKNGPALAGGQLLYPNSKRIQHAGIAHMLWGLGSNFGVGAEPTEPELAHSRESYALTGAMLLAETTFFRELGGFDESYQWGYEDIDLCLKARAAGGRILYEPKAVALHHESATLKPVRNPGQDASNYRSFRRKWDQLLIPAEQSLMKDYSDAGIKTAAIYGTGRAAHSLRTRLSDGGIHLRCFVRRDEDAPPETVGDVPNLTLSEAGNLAYDRLFVGSQYYFQARPRILEFHPADKVLFPIAIR